ncbi:MAG TPA: PP2C family protein-serine/threonine phosphatase [Anaerolineales bacterium]|jgi:sigma-B regulation protein RsbU (phosphoserine phosphatase)
MGNKLFDDIQNGLQQKRAAVYHWVETTPEEKRLIQLGEADEAAVEEHLHVIDTSLEHIEQGTFGICEICHEAVDSELLQMDYTATVCLGHFSDEELRQLEGELELSQVVQRALLPQQVPSIAGLNIAAFSRPAQIVSGDYFDFVDFKDGAHGFVMADVSGHGVSAGMLMTSLQMAFHTLVPDAHSPVEVLERINRVYLHNINFTTFVTILFARFDPATRVLTYANAGHNSGYLFHAAKQEETWLHPTGPAIGLMEGFDLQAADVRLDPGDILLLYTDGVTEAANAQGEQFGEDLLAAVIQANPDATPEQLIAKVLAALKVFTDGNPLVDDVTLVVCKVSV